MTEVTEKRETTATTQPLQENGANASAEAAKNSGAEMEPPRHDAPAANKKSGGGAIAIVALMIAVGAAIAGYGGWQQLHQRQAAMEARLNSEEQSMSGLQSATQTERDHALSLQQQIAALEKSVEETRQHDARVDEGLAEINKRLEERRGSDWLVAEARHLISIASYQAQLNHDTKAALSALEGADQRLRDADDPALLKARQALSSDITALRSITSVDIPGIALQLSQLEQQVAALPLAGLEEQPVASAEPATAAQPSALERFFLKVWSDLKGMVTIRHNNGPQGSPITTPDERIYLQQNLRLKLEVARLALLQHDTQTFRTTLATLRQWLEGYYDTKAATTAAMLATLAPFATVELQPELPDFSNALNALDSWQEQRQSRIKGQSKVDAPLQRESTAS